MKSRSRYSNGLGGGRPGFNSQQCEIIFSSTARADQPSYQWVPGVKLSGYECDHSYPSNANVKNGGAIPPVPHMSLCHSKSKYLSKPKPVTGCES
jgi:hypothetical protein